MLRAIRVYGPLARFLKRRVFRAEVSTPAEAVRFLIANFPAVEAHMNKHDYQIKVGNYTLDVDKNTDCLHMTSSTESTIAIIPVVAGAGTIGRIIAGIALVALSFVTFGAGAFAGLGVAGAWGSTIAFGVGASLALGGVAQLLSPIPTPSFGADSESDPRKSYSFSGIQNTSRQGTPVPVIYGETIVGSIVISAGISTEKVAT